MEAHTRHSQALYKDFHNTLKIYELIKMEVGIDKK